MTKDNEDALRCAESQQKIARMNGGIKSVFISQKSLLDSSAHLRRLVAENEAKDALLRQAVGVIIWECGSESSFYAEKTRTTIAAIRQHLEGKA